MAGAWNGEVEDLIENLTGEIEKICSLLRSKHDRIGRETFLVCENNLLSSNRSLLDAVRRTTFVNKSDLVDKGGACVFRSSTMLGSTFGSGSYC